MPSAGCQKQADGLFLFWRWFAINQPNAPAPAKIGVVVVAAGSGRRLGLGYNKAYLKILERYVLAYSVGIFDNLGDVSEIVVVTGSEDVVFCREAVIEAENFGKVKDIVPGGRERQNSVYEGIRALGSDIGIVLVHDGARPCVRPEDVENLISHVVRDGAAALAVPVKDTIKLADEAGYIIETPPRDLTWAMQTPQGFQRELLESAYEKASADGFVGTDECALVERLGVRIKLVKGSYDNIKLTTPEDIAAVESILAGRRR